MLWRLATVKIPLHVAFDFGCCRQTVVFVTAVAIRYELRQVISKSVTLL